MTRIPIAIYFKPCGSGLHAEPQIRARIDLLNRSVLDNPHSENPTSLTNTHKVEEARQNIRKFFNADAS